MPDKKTFAEEADERFGEGVRFAFQDAMQRRLRYHLLRLTVVGLSQKDVEQLGELGGLVFQDADVTEQVRAITERSDASPLASAIAAIIQGSGPRAGAPRRRAEVMVGAVVGAYAGIRDGPGQDQMQTAILGAVGGGIAASVGPFIQERIAEVGEAEYVRTDEPS